jgi:16S rRNA (uracil1498-N3)-methyltransferase
MHRFFINNPVDSVNKKVTIIGSEAHHIVNVLRLSVGAQIELIDGTGMVREAEITSAVANKVDTQIIRQYQYTDNDPFPLTLAQAILKGKKMDIILEKASELGVSAFIPVLSRYSQPGKGLARRIARWQRIAIAASKQCGRTSPMTILPPCHLEELVITSYSYRIFCWEELDELKNNKNIHPDFFIAPGEIVLLVGPEGGFHQEEVIWAADNDFTAVSLGTLILRAETAAISSVSVVRHLCLLKSR